MLKLGLWNARSLVSKINELSCVIDNFDIICITETWMKRNRNLLMKNYLFFSNNTDYTAAKGHKGGVCS